jgi:hypothetical protein
MTTNNVVSLADYRQATYPESLTTLFSTTTLDLLWPTAHKLTNHANPIDMMLSISTTRLNRQEGKKLDIAIYYCYFGACNWSVKIRRSRLMAVALLAEVKGLHDIAAIALVTMTD